MATTEDSGAIGLLLDNLECKTEDVVDADFWRLLPVINVDKTDIYAQMMETAVNAGLAVMPKNKAAKLLAALQAYGDEPFVLAGKLHTDTMLAARVLKIEPGVIPPRKNAKAVRDRLEEIFNAKTGEVPAWLSELGEEYGVTFSPYRRK